MKSGKRLRLSEKEDWSEPVRAILGSENPPSLAILYALGHHPRLLGPFLGYSATLATQGVLPRREAEILALRSAWNCRSEFEWGHHAHYAREAGLSEAEIAAIALEPAAGGWNRRDLLLVTAADQLHAQRTIASETWEGLAAIFDEAQLVELVMIVGHYAMLSMLANAADIPLEEGFERLPKPEGQER